jgi:hypothetical protein
MQVCKYPCSHAVWRVAYPVRCARLVIEDGRSDESLLMSGTSLILHGPSGEVSEQLVRAMAASINA